MSTGFSNNNPGNVNYYGGTPYDGFTGVTITTTDGQHNAQFADVVYGLRALIEIIDNDIENKHYNLFQLVRSYSGNNNANFINDYCQVINEYAQTDLNVSPDASPLNYSLPTILAIAKGIVQNEIPEYNQITNEQWQQALNFFSGNPYRYTASNDNRVNPTLNNQSNVAGFNIWVILALFGAGLFFFKRK
jgi:hypothetical protein